MKVYQVQLTRTAEKELEGLPKQAADRILSRIRGLGAEPRPRDCKKLVGQKNAFRIRVGDYRVVYEIHDDKVIVLVIRIRHRKDAYQ